MIYQDINFKICLSLFGWKENILPKEHIVQWPIYILLGKDRTLLIWALWSSEQKVEWMDTPIDCYDFYSTCGANKCFVPTAQLTEGSHIYLQLSK